MKKRIIAALTALVMVVTMIPASAFAASNNSSITDVVDLINDATTGTVEYSKDKLAKLDAAYSAAYGFGLGKVKEQREAEYKKLMGTVAGFKLYLEAARAFNEEVAKVNKNGGVTVNGTSLKATDTKADITNIKTAFSALNVDNNANKNYNVTTGAWEAAGTANTVEITVAGNLTTAQPVSLDGISVALKDAFKYKDADEKEQAYTSANTNVVSSVAFAKVLYTDGTGADNTNLFNLIKAINELKADEIAKATIENLEASTVAAVKTALEADAETAKYGYLAEKYSDYARVRAIINDKAALDKNLDKALKELKGQGDVTHADYTAVAITDKNYAEAKAAYDVAKKAYDEYFVEYAKRYPLSATNTREKQPIQSAKDLNDALEGMFDTDKEHAKENKVGSLQAYDIAVENQKIVAELADKANLSVEDIAKFDKINATAKKADGDAWFNANLANTEDFITAEKEISTAAKTTTKYIALKQKVEDFYNHQISKDAIGKYYGDKLAAVIAKLPSITELSVRHTAIINEATALLDEYAEMSKKAGITEGLVTKPGFSATNKINAGEGFRLGTNGIVAGAATGTLVTCTDLKTLDKYLEASKLDTDSFKKLLNAAEAIANGQTGNDDLIQDAITKLETARALVATAIITETEKEAARKALKAYDEAVAKLSADDKAYLETIDKDGNDKKDVKELETLREGVAMFNAISDEKVKDACLEAQNLIKEMKLASEAPDAKDLNAWNKVRIEKVEKIFADKTVKYVFEHATTDGDYKNAPDKLVYNKLDPQREGYNTYLKLYKAVKAEFDLNNDKIDTTKVAAVEKAIDELKALPANDKVKFADVDAAIAACDAAKASYDKLTSVEKASVRNLVKYDNARKDIVNKLVYLLETEMNKIVKIYDNKLDDGQKAVVANVDKLLAKYEKALEGYFDPKADITTAQANAVFKAPFSVGNADEKAGLYIAAKKLVIEAEANDAVKEIKAVYDAINDAVAIDKIENYVNGQAVLDGIAAYNGLSDFAKAYLVDGAKLTSKNAFTEKGTQVKSLDKAKIEKLLANEKKAQAFFFKYASVEKIADQELVDGKAEPVVVVKDALGNVIDAKNYKVAYVNNTEVGTAKVIIDAVGTIYSGRIEAEFNIISNAVPAPTNLQVIGTDNGVLKVGVDAIEGVEGLTYKFFVRKIGNEKWVEKETTENVATFTGLTKNGEYDVKAVAIVNGEASDEVVKVGTVYANRIGTRSALMYKPVIEKVTIKKGVAKVTVKEFNYNNIKYSLGFKKANAKSYKWLKYTTRTVKTVKNLKKGVKYTFKVKYQYTSEVSGTTIKSAKWSNGVTKVAR